MKNGLLFAIVLGVLVSCTSNQTAEVRLSGPTMGSSYNITYLDREARNFGPQIDSLLLVFNEVFSTYDSSSVISYFNQSDTGIALIGESLQWFRELMQATDSVYQASSGAFNPALGPLISFWGFYDKAQSLQILPDSAELDSLLKISRYENITLQQQFLLKSVPQSRLDVNAIAPGFACDILGNYLEAQGVENYIVEIGGEIRARGANGSGKSWSVGIRIPEELSDELASTIRLANRSLATSGNYNKYIVVDGRKLGHTIDAVNGVPAVNSLLSTTTVTDLGIYADAYATACLALGLEKAKELVNAAEGLEAYLLYADENNQLKSWYSEGLKPYLNEAGKE